MSQDQQPPRGEMSCREAGRRGGRRTSETHTTKERQEWGRKGGTRTQELIRRGRALEGLT